MATMGATTDNAFSHSSFHMEDEAGSVDCDQFGCDFDKVAFAGGGLMGDVHVGPHGCLFVSEERLRCIGARPFHQPDHLGSRQYDDRGEMGGTVLGTDHNGYVVAGARLK